MKRLLFALLTLGLLASCGNNDDRGETDPHILGTAHFDNETIYFISSTLHPLNNKWGTGIRISLHGYSTVRWPGDFIDGDYTVNLRLPSVDETRDYRDADLSDLETLTIRKKDDKTYRYGTNVEDGSLGVVSGTFSLVETVENSGWYDFSFEFFMSDGKKFDGNATLRKGGVRPVKP